MCTHHLNTLNKSLQGKIGRVLQKYAHMKSFVVKIDCPAVRKSYVQVPERRHFCKKFGKCDCAYITVRQNSNPSSVDVEATQEDAQLELI